METDENSSESHKTDHSDQLDNANTNAESQPDGKQTSPKATADTSTPDCNKMKNVKQDNMEGATGK